jgi:hypothetical protein
MVHSGTGVLPYEARRRSGESVFIAYPCGFHSPHLVSFLHTIGIPSLSSPFGTTHSLQHVYVCLAYIASASYVQITSPAIFLPLHLSTYFERLVQ